jgi:hypothetical protein
MEIATGHAGIYLGATRRAHALNLAGGPRFRTIQAHPIDLPALCGRLMMR